MPYLTVTRRKPRTFEVDVDGHALVVEERTPAGHGRGAGPTPVELTVAALASGVAATVDEYLVRQAFRGAGVRVSAHYRLNAAAPHRVSSVDLTVTLPPEVPLDLRAELQRAIGQRILDAAMPQPAEVGVILVAGEAASTSAR